MACERRLHVPLCTLPSCKTEHNTSQQRSKNRTSCCWVFLFARFCSLYLAVCGYCCRLTCSSCVLHCSGSFIAAGPTPSVEFNERYRGFSWGTMADGAVQEVVINNPQKEGYLEKQSRYFKRWKKRWFVLQDSTLYSFKEKGVCHNIAVYSLCRRCKFSSLFLWSSVPYTGIQGSHRGYWSQNLLFGQVVWRLYQQNAFIRYDILSCCSSSLSLL